MAWTAAYLHGDHGVLSRDEATVGVPVSRHPLDRLQSFRKLVLENQAEGVVGGDFNGPGQAAISSSPDEEKMWGKCLSES